MLTSAQLKILAEEIDYHGFHGRCPCEDANPAESAAYDQRWPQHTAVTIAPMIEKWIDQASAASDAERMKQAETHLHGLRVGDLPEGWERREEWAIRHSREGRTHCEEGGEGWARYFAAPERRTELEYMLQTAVDDASAVHRTAITGPWESDE